MTTGEGGMIVTNDEAYSQRMHLLRSHGMTTLTWDRHKGHAWSYDVVDLGYNYRIDEIRAALGKVQLAKLDENNARRRRLTQVYRGALQDLTPQVVIPFAQHPGISAAHLMPVLLPDGTNRASFMESMKSQGIQTSIHYPPIHTFTAYNGGKAKYALPITQEIAAREVSLPLYPAMSDEDVFTVTKAIAQALIPA
jgi:dTDP-4-amino-4,6-dideoxygalactose transaminase